MTLGELLDRLTSQEVADSISDALEVTARAVITLSEFLSSPEFAASVARAATMLSEAFELIDSLLGATPPSTQAPPVSNDYVVDSSDESFVDTVKALTEVFVGYGPAHSTSAEIDRGPEGAAENVATAPLLEREIVKRSIHHVQGTYKDVAPFILPILILYFGKEQPQLFAMVLISYLIGRRLMDPVARDGD